MPPTMLLSIVMLLCYGLLKYHFEETNIDYFPPYSATNELIFAAQHDLLASSGSISSNISSPSNTATSSSSNVNSSSRSSVYDDVIGYAINKFFKNYSFSQSLWEFSVVELLIYLVLIVLIRDESTWILGVIGITSHSLRFWSDSDLFLNINSHPLSLLLLNLQLLLVFELASRRKLKFVMLLVFCSLLYCKIEFFYLSPFIIALSNRNEAGGDCNSVVPSTLPDERKSFSWGRYTIIVIKSIVVVVALLLAVFGLFTYYKIGPEGLGGQERGGSIIRNTAGAGICASSGYLGSNLPCLLRQIFVRNFPGSFRPNIGIFWYLDAEILEGFVAYFELLFVLQPFILAYPLYLRVGQKMPAHGFAIMVLVIQYFRKETNLTDLMFAFYIFYRIDSKELAENKKMINIIRFKGWLVLGMVIPVIMTPVMLRLWVDFGSGNANFLFFQGFILWFFVGIAIVEFSRSSVILVDNLER